jgi:hypothetical protein
MTGTMIFSERSSLSLQRGTEDYLLSMCEDGQRREEEVGVAFVQVLRHDKYTGFPKDDLLEGIIAGYILKGW